MPYEIIEDLPQENASNTNLSELGRHAARGTARAAETLIGLPGDIASTAVNFLSRKTGGKVPTYEEAHKSWPTLFPPTSKHTREFGEQFTGESLKPQNKNEEYWDEFVGDVASIFNPFKSGTSVINIAKKAARAVGITGLSNLADWATETFTGSPTAGKVAKIGTIVLASAKGGRKKVIEQQKQSYDEAFSHLPNEFNFSDTRDKLVNLEKHIPSKYHIEDIISKPTAPTNKVSKILDTSGKPITNIIPGNKGGLADPKKIIEQKQNLNRFLADPNIDKKSKGIIKNMVGVLNEGIAKLGEKYPAFYKPYKIGEEITEGLKSTNIIQNFLSKHPALQNNINNPIVKSLVFGGIGHSVGLPTLAVVGGTALGGREMAKTVQLLSKSPAARSTYKKVMSAALKEDSKLIAKELKKLDKIANKYNIKSKNIGRYEIISQEENPI